MKVKDIMTTNVSTAEPDTTLEEIATIMRDEDIGAVPVIEGSELLGIITDRDIVIRCIAEGQHPSELCAEDILTDDVEIVRPDSDVDEAADTLLAVIREALEAGGTQIIEPPGRQDAKT